MAKQRAYRDQAPRIVDRELFDQLLRLVQHAGPTVETVEQDEAEHAADGRIGDRFHAADGDVLEGLGSAEPGLRIAVLHAQRKKS